MDKRLVNIIIEIIIIIVIVFSLRFFLGLLAGEFPVIEASYNTKYSMKFDQKSFRLIKEGDNKEQVYNYLGYPFREAEAKYKDSVYEIFYYSHLREGAKFGKIGSINARIIILSENKVVKKISDRLLITNIYPNTLLNNIFN